MEYLNEGEEISISLALKITYYVFLILMIIFTIILIIVYIKDKNMSINAKNKDSPGIRMKVYICYFNVFFCVVIVIEDLLRLIPDSIGVGKSQIEDNPNFICSLQAFCSSFFDKLLLSNMTIYSIITFLGVFYSEFYKNHIKAIFIVLISIGLAFSLGLTIAYITEGISFKDIVCSIHTRTNLKIISDNIYTSFLFTINILSLISLILYLNKLKSTYQREGKDVLFRKSSNFLKRYLLDLLINIIAFIYILLTVNKVFARGSYKDILYLIICLAIELFFSLNRTLFEGFVRTVSCGKYYNEPPKTEEQDNEQEGEGDQNYLAYHNDDDN
jgi:hypothetical protein